MAQYTTLHDYGLAVLNTNETEDKAKLTQEAFQLFNDKTIPYRATERVEPPEKPARPANVQIVSPKNAPKRGGGSLQNRIALLHSLCHMESYAIDLSWDIISRFSQYATIHEI
jgi:uncharacterized ferritin-like protein (DUF455 family)